MSRNDHETVWDGCPMCNEWVRFGFLSQSCPCGWSLDGADARRSDRTLAIVAWVGDWIAIATLIVAGTAIGADVAGVIDAPMALVSVFLLTAPVLLVFAMLVRRALRATIGGGVRAD